MSNFVLSDSLKPIMEAYRWSMQRTSNIFHLPAWIALEATREQLWLDHATVMAGGTINPDLKKHSSDTESPEIVTEFNRLVQKHREGSHEIHREFFYNIGIGFIERRLSDSEAVVEGLKSLYDSVILDSWSAFEILVRDLWVLVLDQSPAIATKVHIRLAPKSE
jgi:hypothetical protein